MFGIVEGLIITFLIAILLIAIIMWLGPMAGIPGNILNILKIIVIVWALFKIITMLLGGF